MGDGVPNAGIMPHFEGDALVGYYCWYHDQMVTGNDWKQSVQMTPAKYADLHEAAYVGQAAFNAEWAIGPWAAFSALYTGIRLGAMRQCAKLVLPPTP